MYTYTYMPVAVVDVVDVCRSFLPQGLVSLGGHSRVWGWYNLAIMIIFARL